MNDEATQVEELSLEAALGEQEGEKTEEKTEVKEDEAQAENAETEAEPKESETPSDTEKDPSWHLKAVLDERDKRQAAQREAQQLREQLDELKKGKDAPKTSVFDDEGKFRSEILTDIEQSRLNDKLNMSQALAEDKWGADVVAAKVKVFSELAKESPEIRAEFRDAALPYHAMVRIVDRHEKAKELENLGSKDYEDKLRATIRSELEAELKAKQDELAAKRNSISPSLATKRSEGGTSESGSLIGLEDVLTD